MTIFVCFCIHILCLIASIVLFTLTAINKKRYSNSEYFSFLLAWTLNAGLNIGFLINLIAQVHS